MSEDNLALWQLVEKTPIDQTKAITGKSYSGNSPKPHYLIKKATEVFGPIGIGWGFDIVDERIEDGVGGERLHVARVSVWYVWNGQKAGPVSHIGSTPFCGTRSSGKTFLDEDAPKKSVTDALVKALSLLGFAGDIFSGRYDDSKYIAELKREAAGDPERAPPAPAPKPNGIRERAAPGAMQRESILPPLEPSPAAKMLAHAGLQAKSLKDYQEWRESEGFADVYDALSAEDRRYVAQTLAPHRIALEGKEAA